MVEARRPTGNLLWRPGMEAKGGKWSSLANEVVRQVWLLYGKDRLSNQHPLTNKCVLSTYAGSQPHQGEL